jgi:hypothetical protein
MVAISINKSNAGNTSDQQNGGKSAKEDAGLAGQQRAQQVARGEHRLLAQLRRHAQSCSDRIFIFIAYIMKILFCIISMNITSITIILKCTQITSKVVCTKKIM